MSVVKVNILIEERLKKSITRTWLEMLAKKVLLAQNIDAKAELDLFIVGQDRIRQLNLSYLGEDRPTDVLSFSMLPGQANSAPFVLPPDGKTRLGEVIISYPQAVIQAQEHQHSVKREIAILLIHGVLHLLGYDHDEPEREQKMRARESEILGMIGGLD